MIETTYSCLNETHYLKYSGIEPTVAVDKLSKLFQLFCLFHPIPFAEMEQTFEGIVGLFSLYPFQSNPTLHCNSLFCFFLFLKTLKKNAVFILISAIF